ncbi:putative mitochondrial protein [Dendrobium catenatum]|uniref:Putative mitochondrial protein n=1 Tax=Dendrobium catenatum TaxID=906689 RepID=A0A2I0W8K0_9ASPA|nr:putative mitochondrial protein [Dendrobium catenatum]
MLPTLPQKGAAFIPPKMLVPPSGPSKQHNSVPRLRFIPAKVVYGQAFQSGAIRPWTKNDDARKMVRIAQLVEQRTENPRVTSSNLDVQAFQPIHSLAPSGGRTCHLFTSRSS